ncbi:MAG: aminopeptidase P family protein [Deltaproteobacteria bacterium]|nr:aminopeptidase P family protein [Deltaproteobacteria bacterium]
MHRLHRRNLCKKLQNGFLFSIGSEELSRNGSDVNFVFRQDSNFLYLTGVEEPGYAFILDLSRNYFHLFIPKVDAKHIVWLGHVPDLSESKKVFGADKVSYITDLEIELKKISKTKDLYFLKTNHEKGLKLCKKYFRIKPEEKKLHCALAELRIKKSKEEITLMKEAAEMTSLGHIEAMKKTRPGLYEYQIQSYLEQKFLEKGAQHCAYPSIVGAGKNAAILHYHHNSSQLQKGDLLLIDAGAEVKGYASDVTRTFPISGKFTQKQKDMYDLVLKMQEECIQGVKPGVLFYDLHLLSARILLKGLKDLGLLKGSVENMLRKGVDKLFYPHGLGHFLGLDVHDVVPPPVIARSRATKQSRLRASRKLEENNVITIEPGVYFIPALLKDPNNRKKFKDFVHWSKVDPYLQFGGIRIEDDVVITPKKPLILTHKCPKKVNDLENIKN